MVKLEQDPDFFCAFSRLVAKSRVTYKHFAILIKGMRLIIVNFTAFKEAVMAIG